MSRAIEYFCTFSESKAVLCLVIAVWIFSTIALLPAHPNLPPLKTATHRVPRASVTAVPEESGLNNAPQRPKKATCQIFKHLFFL